MAKLFEMSEHVVGVSANGECFIVTPEDVMHWANELSAAGKPDVVSFDYDCRRLTATYDYGTAEEFTAFIGEGEFWLPREACEAFCEAFARAYKCAIA